VGLTALVFQERRTREKPWRERAKERRKKEKERNLLFLPLSFSLLGSLT
jgi:hypothetical protein